MTPKLSARLSKLLPMLASENDAEILATVRAIRAALLGEGLDLHDLAAAISGVEVVAVARAPQIAAAPSWANLSHQERCGWMKVILADANIGVLEKDRLADLDALLRTGSAWSYPWRRVRIFDERLANCYARGMRP